MAKSIEINYNNGLSYDVLYPQTNMANIVDWTSNVYSKTQTYTRTEITTLINNAVASNSGTTYIITGSYTPTTYEVTLTLTKSNPRFIILGIQYGDYISGFTDSSVRLNCSNIFDLTSSTAISKYERYYVCVGQYGSGTSSTLLVQGNMQFTKTATTLNIYGRSSGYGIYSSSASNVTTISKVTSTIGDGPYFMTGYTVDYALIYSD